MANVEALEKLHELLIENANNEKGMRFDLDGWTAPYSHSEDWIPAMDCGTVGCAVGLAGIHPWFQERGFVCNPAPVYRTDIIWDAVVEFFDVSFDTALHLFDVDRYKGLPTKGRDGELAVAERIRRFIDSGSKV